VHIRTRVDQFTFASGFGVQGLEGFGFLSLLFIFPPPFFLHGVQHDIMMHSAGAYLLIFLISFHWSGEWVFGSGMVGKIPPFIAGNIKCYQNTSIPLFEVWRKSFDMGLHSRT
jgi:hypothetical protein